jgi:hypothetical protein
MPATEHSEFGVRLAASRSEQGEKQANIPQSQNNSMETITERADF